MMIAHNLKKDLVLEAFMTMIVRMRDAAIVMMVSLRAISPGMRAAWIPMRGAPSAFLYTHNVILIGTKINILMHDWNRLSNPRRRMISKTS